MDRFSNIVEKMAGEQPSWSMPAIIHQTYGGLA